MWECLNKFRKSHHEINEIVKMCKNDFKLNRFLNIRNLKELKSMNEQDKSEFGCSTKCFYDQMGSYNNGIYDTLHFVQSSGGDERVVKKVKDCHEEMNKKYSKAERYSCRYFFDLDLCIGYEEF